MELPGVYHRSALLPLWRDLGVRIAIAGQDPWLRAAHLDHIEGRTQSNEAWYRVSAVGFTEKNAATAYCDALMHAGQSCKVAPVSENRSVFSASR